MTYGSGKYNAGPYGRVEDKNAPWWRVSYEGVPVGLRVRGQIGHRWIYRARRQNAINGVQGGEIVQDKYGYFVPRSITNPQGEPARIALREAVRAWQTSVTPEQKSYWRALAREKGGTTGYAEFIGHYIRQAVR